MNEQPRSFRPTESMITNIDKAVLAHPAKYTGRSHFIRCAVVRLLREEGGENE